MGKPGVYGELVGLHEEVFKEVYQVGKQGTVCAMSS